MAFHSSFLDSTFGLPPLGLCSLLSSEPTLLFAFQFSFCVWIVILPPAGLCLILLSEPIFDLQFLRSGDLANPTDALMGGSFFVSGFSQFEEVASFVDEA